MRRLGPLSPLVRFALFGLTVASLVTLAWWLVSPMAGLLTAAIAGFLVLLGVAVLVLPAWLVTRDTTAGDLSPEQRASAVNSARTTLVQGFVGLAALAGIFVAWQQLQTDREQSRTDRQQLTAQLTLTRQGQVAERFTRAVDQLGSDKLEQRLGGIYGLERIAKEAPDGDARLVVAEVLTAYVRQHAPRDTKARPDDVPRATLAVRAPDVQAAMTVLGRRIVMAKDPKLDLSEVDLRRAELEGSNLQGAMLVRAQLQGADLHGAQLQRAFLGDALLQDADLAGAQLQGAFLNRAQLQDAYLFTAQLQRANLARAQLQRALLGGAQFQEAIFSGAQLDEANLQGAQLQGAADLSSADLKGAVFDAQTAWPHGFDWKAAGLIMA